eukprot:TRINITY_DN11747_c0_g1_i1.p1 TRINITY_DN11747_c0_g1~~TRINITY_DN11747_c0_g1_i1.p1  ORF type:complete len:702 (+),score=92.48 TRINITY_DN11747_c0_g1_i1:1762-3867(+)
MFAVMVDGVAVRSGTLGYTEAALETGTDFFAESRVPLLLTQGDVVQIPVTTTASSRTAGSEARVRVSSSALEPSPGDDVLPPGGQGAGPGEFTVMQTVGSVRAYAGFSVPHFAAELGEASVTVAANLSSGPADTVTRTFAVSTAGFPARPIDFAGRVGEAPATHSVVLPHDMVPGSLKVRAGVAASPASSISDALHRLLREPYGCFEQVSMTTYPLTMALAYFGRHPAPSLAEKARSLLAKGYHQLVQFESSGPERGGFEWFGGSPAHEALTAYGLLQFTDMEEVMPGLVDAKLLARTKNWLLSRRSGSGGFLRNRNALDDFGMAPQAVTDTYIVWALATAGVRDIEPELTVAVNAELQAVASGKGDPYRVAMAAAAALKVGRVADVQPLVAWLVEAQRKGLIGGAAASITMSGGVGLAIESTAMAALALLRAGEVFAGVQAVDWIEQQNSDGWFWNTQATVLALKAIVEADSVRTQSASECAALAQFDIAGRVIGVEQKQDQGLYEVDREQLKSLMKAGPNQVSVRLTGDAENCSVPYLFSASYSVMRPTSDPQAQLRLETGLSKSVVAEGDSVDVVVDMTNTLPRGLPMAVARIGLPGGLEWRDAKVRETREQGKIAFYELTGRELTLYWRAVQPNQRISLRFDAHAAIPGQYQGAASSAYLYYDAEKKTWAEPLRVRVTPSAMSTNVRQPYPHVAATL